MDELQPERSERGGVIGWIERHPKTVAAFALLMLVVLVVMGLDVHAEHGLKRRIAAIKAKGEPITVDDLNKRQPNVPDEENMLIGIVRHGQSAALVKIPEDKTASLPIEGMAVSPRTGEPWPDDQFQAAQWYLSKVAADLEGVRAALKLSKSHLNVAWSSPLFAIVISQYSPIRTSSKMMLLDALTSAHAGEPLRAGERLAESLPLLHVVPHDLPLIGALVQMAITSLYYDTVERCINRCTLSDDALREIGKALGSTENAIDIKSAFHFERVMFLDGTLWARRNRATATLVGGGPSAVNAWCFVPALPALDIAEGLDVYSYMIGGIGDPDMKSIAAISAAEARAGTMAWYCVTSKILIPSLSRCGVLWVRTAGQTRALQAAVAAERYRLANGQWPSKLEDLEPTYLGKVPTDPIDGKPIRYALIPEGVKTWTISDDANNQDDGGDVQRIEPKEKRHRPMDFGWVILNPELRGRAATTQGAAMHP